MANRSITLSTLVGLLLFACAPSGGPIRTERDAGSGAPDGGRSDGGPPPPRPDAGPYVPPSACSTGPGRDVDEDGFAYEVDCNDCAPQVNPGAFDAPDNGIDEDCDGADRVAATASCDTGLALTGAAADAARAMGLCQTATAGDSRWGVLSARYSLADGTGAPLHPTQTGILPSFGANAPREGSALFALSSGAARAPGQAGFTADCDNYDEFTEQSYPPGFPQDSSSCPGIRGGPVFDSVALELTIRVPTNALGFSFRSGFFTYEYPEYICDEFNDFFAVLRSDEGSSFSNIVFDADDNPVSVNNSLLRGCEAGYAGGQDFACPLGRAPLVGTGYGNDGDCGINPFPNPFTDNQEVGGATGWLRTVAPVEGGQTLTLRFIVWDSGDSDLDSLAIIDAFEWELDPVTVTETVPDLI